MVVFKKVEYVKVSKEANDLYQVWSCWEQAGEDHYQLFEVEFDNGREAEVYAAHLADRVGCDWGCNY